MSTVSGIIFDIKKYSIHDGPGIRTTVFFKGCPLHCWWCHNPESQSPQPELLIRGKRCVQCGVCREVCTESAIHNGIVDGSAPDTDRLRCRVCGQCVEVCFSGARELVGRRATAGEVLAEIERDRPFYDQSGGGVTFSGGEPLMQPVFLLTLLGSCREKDIHTTLDTSGFAPWRVLEKTISLVNLFLYDLKIVNDTHHREYTGVSNRLILQNLRRLSDAGVRLVVRIPLIPGVNEDEASLRIAGKYLSGLSNMPQVEVMPYHDIAEAKYESLGRAYRLHGLKPPTQEKLAQVVKVLQSYGLSTSSQSLPQSQVSEVFYDGQRAHANLAPAVAASG